jgi:hypothetical protein
MTIQPRSRLPTKPLRVIGQDYRFEMRAQTLQLLILGMLFVTVQARVILTGPAPQASVVSGENTSFSQDHSNVSELRPQGSATSDYALSLPEANHNQSALRKRQCVKNGPGDDDWACDLLWPTFNQMEARMRDTNNHGRLVPENHLVFYSNLRKPTDEERANGPEVMDAHEDLAVWLSWCEGWMKANNLPSVHMYNVLDIKWLYRQYLWLDDHWEQMERGGPPPLVIQPGQWKPNFPPPIDVGDAGYHFTGCLLQTMCVRSENPDVYLFTSYDMDPYDDSTWAEIEFPSLTLNTDVQRIWRVDPAPGAQCHAKELLWSREKDQPLPIRWVCPVKNEDT